MNEPHVKLGTSGLTFVITHIDVDGALPVAIDERHTFRKATDHEAEEIQVRLDALSITGMPGKDGIRYRHIVKEVRQPNGGSSYQFENLPRDRWKYWVIAFEGINDAIQDLEHAAILLPVDLDFGMTFWFFSPRQQGDVAGFSSMPLHLVEKYLDPMESWQNARRVHASQIARIGEHYARIKALPEGASFVAHALKNFYAMRAIPSRSDIRVIGYFAIIESLVTHAPRSAETLDSINHQVVNKLILLGKRFERQIPFDQYFLDAPPEKLWQLLYSYRSAVAHGGTPDFRRKLLLLKSQEPVVQFLKEVIKELLIFGMKEYAFLADLKNC